MNSEATSFRPNRWSRPFGGEPMKKEDVARALTEPVFSEINPEDFPQGTEFEQILAFDGRIRIYDRGEAIVRRGEYGSSLFVVLDGSLQGTTADSTSETLGLRKSLKKMSWLEALRRMWRAPKVPEQRPETITAPDNEIEISSTGAKSKGSISPVKVKNIDAMPTDGRAFNLNKHDMFGEISALTRTPRRASVFAMSDRTRCLEIRWEGLRDIRRWSSEFHDRIDTLYRRNGLRAFIAETPIFADLGDDALDDLAKRAVFETFGEFEWSKSFQEKKRTDKDDKLINETEPLIASQGSIADDLIVIVSGFARESESVDYGQRTRRVMSTGDVFGLTELSSSYQGGVPVPLQTSLRAIGYVDILRVPVNWVHTHLPTPTTSQFLSTNVAAPEIDQPLLDFLVDGRYVNGTAAMVIDLERCVRCDDCVVACAAAHDGNPRFVRNGPSHGRFMIAHACMHCADPVCLIGCPTGAIHRNLDGGQVIIEEQTCIGCETCVKACPYDNILMVELRGKPQAKDAAIEKATKCDLCSGRPGGAACQSACPHDALHRMDIRDMTAFANWAAK